MSANTPINTLRLLTIFISNQTLKVVQKNHYEVKFLDHPLLSTPRTTLIKHSFRQGGVEMLKIFHEFERSRSRKVTQDAQSWHVIDPRFPFMLFPRMYISLYHNMGPQFSKSNV